jgi:hypothetical protein
MAVVCFKVAKHFASPSGAYLEYMLYLPVMMKCTTVDATFLLFDNPDTQMSTYQQKKGMTIEEYKAWITKLLEPWEKMPKEDKKKLVMNHLHLL